MDSGVCQCAVLSDGLVLQVWRPLVRKRIVARIVVIAVSPDVWSKIENRIRTNHARIRRRDIECLNLGTLIGVADIVAELVEHIQIVIGIRRLKPRTAVVQVQMKGVDRRKLIIRTVKDILLVALGVEYLELRRIEKASRIQSVDLEKITPGIATVPDIDRTGRRSKAPIRARNASRGRLLALPGPCCRVDNETRLAAVLRRRRARNYFERLN